MTVRRNVLWSAWSGVGLEHLCLDVSAGGVTADGLVISVIDGQPVRVRYAIQCDPDWRTRAVRVELLNAELPLLVLLSDGEGHWTGADGITLPALAGCLDVDISVTPFTNSLPIRRVHSALGAERRLSVAYISVPELSVFPDPQAYTLLSDGPDEARYRFRSLDSDFTAEITVDADGIVLEYPEIARCISFRKQESRRR